MCVVPSDPQCAEHLFVVRVPAPEDSNDEGVHLDAREALLPLHPLRQGLVLGPLCLPRLLQCIFFALIRDGDVDYQSMFLVRTDDNQVWAAVGRVTLGTACSTSRSPVVLGVAFTRQARMWLCLSLINHMLGSDSPGGKVSLDVDGIFGIGWMLSPGGIASGRFVSGGGSAWP